MARKSISGAEDTSVASTATAAAATTPAVKGRKSISSETPATPTSMKKASDPSGDAAPTSGLIIPPAAKAVFAQQAGALKTLPVGLDQFELPKTSVVKLAKSEIPDNVQLRKEVVTALVKASTVFISYLTAASHDTALSNGLKTISGQNVLDAVRDLDLGVEVRAELKKELDAFRALTKEKRQSKAGSKKTADDGDTNSAAAPIDAGDDDDDDADASRFTTATGADQDEEEDDIDVEQEHGEETMLDDAVDEREDENDAEAGDESVLSVRSRTNGTAHAPEQSMEED